MKLLQGGIQVILAQNKSNHIFSRVTIVVNEDTMEANAHPRRSNQIKTLTDHRGTTRGVESLITK